MKPVFGLATPRTVLIKLKASSYLQPYGGWGAAVRDLRYAVCGLPPLESCVGGVAHWIFLECMR